MPVQTNKVISLSWILFGAILAGMGVYTSIDYICHPEIDRLFLVPFTRLLKDISIGILMLIYGINIFKGTNNLERYCLVILFSVPTYLMLLVFTELILYDGIHELQYFLLDAIIIIFLLVTRKSIGLMPLRRLLSQLRDIRIYGFEFGLRVLFPLGLSILYQVLFWNSYN